MHDAPTILGSGVNLVGAVLLLRHYARLIAEPFQTCCGLTSMFKMLFTMSDATFLGILMAGCFALEFAYENVRLLIVGLLALFGV